MGGNHNSKKINIKICPIGPWHFKNAKQRNHRLEGALKFLLNILRIKQCLARLDKTNGTESYVR
jgi:hypothetical protein